MLKELSLNISLLVALEQMPRYARFMKQLVTRKKERYLRMFGIHLCSAVRTRYLAQKKGDPSAFIIPCTIGSSQFAKALCDLGASINLMPTTIFKQLCLNPPEPTSMWPLMADHTMKKPMESLLM